MGRRRTIFARYVIPTSLHLAKPIALIGSAVTSLSLSPSLVLAGERSLLAVTSQLLSLTSWFGSVPPWDRLWLFPFISTEGNNFAYVLSPIVCQLILTSCYEYVIRVSFRLSSAEFWINDTRLPFLFDFFLGHVLIRTVMLFSMITLSCIGCLNSFSEFLLLIQWTFSASC